MVNFTYGNAFCLHFGRRLSYKSTAPVLKGMKKGEWRLGTLATPWVAFTPNGSITSQKAINAKAEYHKVKGLEGKKVAKINVSVPDNNLIIKFGGGYQFQIAPTATTGGLDLPYWEIFMPDHQIIEFGPGCNWSSSRSDLEPTQQPTSR